MIRQRDHAIKNLQPTKIISGNQKYGLFAYLNVGKIKTILYIFFVCSFLAVYLIEKKVVESFVHENLMLVGCPLSWVYHLIEILHDIEYLLRIQLPLHKF